MLKSLKRLLLAGLILGTVVRCRLEISLSGHLTPDNGLSQVSVIALYIDARGFVWIGTREGLNLYNGNDIKTFRFDKDDPKSLFCNNVLRITGDQSGQYLSDLHRRTGRFGFASG